MQAINRIAQRKSLLLVDFLALKMTLYLPMLTKQRVSNGLYKLPYVNMMGEKNVWKWGD